ncbi:cobalt-precorrin-6A reductase [Clostridium ganghwense]|uniref:Cobalt-precorrin-6A reductase n=1 Tax=Clostridium ganghwense TaxID=312089 RepID=A0ABT4CVU5_9CLOT|nr:cobalt-precorrin-6A reductase [Clostridium ganghwense]MCY6372166.1 cobalt-precorrin-6A reductase [Clostridium ganghwense]
MIGLILGTSEGKKILSLLNKYTEDIFVTTATTYGGELLKDYKYKVLNTKPLDEQNLKEALINNGVTTLVDASHPYAEEITKNAQKICMELSIEYVRYERPSIIKKYKDEKWIIEVESYEELKDKLANFEGCILNTTGSRNIEKIQELKLDNRIVHRILPSTKVMEKMFSLDVKIENLIAIKGPVSYELNCAFIKEYNAKAIILKDSGRAGGTEEKLKASKDCGIYAFVLKRNITKYENVYSSEEALVDYLKSKI